MKVVEVEEDQAWEEILFMLGEIFLRYLNANIHVAVPQEHPRLRRVV